MDGIELALAQVQGNGKGRDSAAQKRQDCVDDTLLFGDGIGSLGCADKAEKEKKKAELAS